MTEYEIKPNILGDGYTAKPKVTGYSSGPLKGALSHSETGHPSIDRTMAKAWPDLEYSRVTMGLNESLRKLRGAGPFQVWRARWIVRRLPKLARQYEKNRVKADTTLRSSRLGLSNRNRRRLDEMHSESLRRSARAGQLIREISGKLEKLAN